MKVRKWLIVSEGGRARITKRQPQLEPDEIGIHLDLDIPNELFKKPRLEAKITVPSEAAATDVIETVVMDNIKETIEKSTGLKFSISVAKEKDE